MQQDLAVEAARNTARIWRAVRWLSAAFCLFQFLVYRPPDTLSTQPFGPGLALTLVLVLTNLVAAAVERRRPRRPRPDHMPARRDVLLLSTDFTVIAAITLLLAQDPSTVLWPLLVLPVLEAGLLGRIRWALGTWCASAALLVGLEVLLVVVHDQPRLGPTMLAATLGYRIGVLLLVALLVGVQAAGTARYIALLHQAQDRLAHEASHDTLTGVAGRSLFLDRAERALRDQRQRGGGAGVLFIDCDDFKAVNDRYGHAAGDEVLVLVAQRLRAAVRPSDTVARLGGDEFGVLLERLEVGDEAALIAARVRAALAPGYQLSDGRTVLMGCSVGLGVDEGAGDSVVTLLQRADLAMYLGKTTEQAARGRAVPGHAVAGQAVPGQAAPGRGAWVPDPRVQGAPGG